MKFIKEIAHNAKIAVTLDTFKNENCLIIKVRIAKKGKTNRERNVIFSSSQAAAGKKSKIF